MRIFTARAASDAGVGLRWLVSGGQDGEGDHGRKRHEPPEDEGGALPDAALGREHQDEGREGDRLEGDHQADEDEVDDHGQAALFVDLACAASSTDPSGVGRAVSRRA
jgi:hypothetical protein